MEKLIATFQKNAQEEIRVALTEFKGYQLIDLRVFHVPPVGEPVPIRKGLTIGVDLYPELRDAVEKLGVALEGKVPISGASGEF